VEDATVQGKRNGCTPDVCCRRSLEILEKRDQCGEVPLCGELDLSDVESGVGDENFVQGEGAPGKLESFGVDCEKNGLFCCDLRGMEEKLKGMGEEEVGCIELGAEGGVEVGGGELEGEVSGRGVEDEGAGGIEGVSEEVGERVWMVDELVQGGGGDFFEIESEVKILFRKEFSREDEVS